MIGKNQKKDQLVIIELNKSEGDIKTDGDYYEDCRLIYNNKGCVVENFKDNISLDQTDIKAQASYYFKKVEKVVQLCKIIAHVHIYIILDFNHYLFPLLRTMI